MRSHEWIDRRSLALHEAVAAKLEAQPDLLRVARENVERWLRPNETAALLESTGCRSRISWHCCALRARMPRA